MFWAISFSVEKEEHCLWELTEIGVWFTGTALDYSAESGVFEVTGSAAG